MEGHLGNASRGQRFVLNALKQLLNGSAKGSLNLTLGLPAHHNLFENCSLATSKHSPECSFNKSLLLQCDPHRDAQRRYSLIHPHNCIWQSRCRIIGHFEQNWSHPTPHHNTFIYFSPPNWIEIQKLTIHLHECGSALSSARPHHRHH